MAKETPRQDDVQLDGRKGNGELAAGVEGVLPGETATARAAHAALKGERKGLRALWPFLGPAFIAAVAYVDPGNFATNNSGGAHLQRREMAEQKYKGRVLKTWPRGCRVKHIRTPV